MLRRWVIVALCLASASCAALSVQAGRWWTRDEIRVEVGPFGSRNCFGGECRSTDLAWLAGPESWMRTGTATWAGGLLAMFLLVLLAGAIAAQRTPKLLAKTALVSVITVGAAGAWFFAKFPQMDGTPLEVGRGFYLFIAAVALGLAATISALRLAPRPDRRA